MRISLITAALVVGVLGHSMGASTTAAVQEDKPPAVDLHGDPLPAGSLARLGTVAFYYDYGHHITYSGNGKILASSDDRVIRLWDAATGRDLGQYLGDRAFALSADGTRLAAFATAPKNGLLSIWDIGSGKELQQLPLHSAVTAVAFSPDGQLLATGGYDGRLRLWNTQTGKLARVLTEDCRYVSGLAFSPDGASLVTGEYLPSGKGPEQIVTRVWEVVSGKVRQRFPEQTFVGLSGNGETLAMASENGRKLQLVKLDNGEALATLIDFTGKPGVPGHMNLACLSPDGKWVASPYKYDEGIRLWDVQSGKVVRTIPFEADFHNYAFCVRFSPDGKTLAVGVPWGLPKPHRVRLLDVATGQQRFPSTKPLDAVYEVRFLPDGKALAVIDADKKLSLWQPTGKLVRELELSKLPRSVSPDGSLVAVSGQLEPRQSGYLVPKREPNLDLRDTATGKVRHQLEHLANVVRVAWSPDGASLAVGTEEDHLYLWNAVTGKLRLRWTAPAPRSLAFSPDGRTLAAGDDDCTVHLWETLTGKLRRRLGNPVDHWKYNSTLIARATAIAFSPDGKTVAAALTFPPSITLWEMTSGQELWKCPAHGSGWKGHVYALAFTPDGKTLFSTGEDQTVRGWDAANGKERLRLEGHRGAVYALAVSPDGTRLASGGKDGTVLMWDLVSLLNSP